MEKSTGCQFYMQIRFSLTTWNQCCSISCVINISNLSTLNLNKKKHCFYQNKSFFCSIQTHFNLTRRTRYIYMSLSLCVCADCIHNIYLNRFAIDLNIIFTLFLCNRPIKNSLTQIQIFQWFQSLMCINISVRNLITCHAFGDIWFSHIIFCNHVIFKPSL